MKSQIHRSELTQASGASCALNPKFATRQESFSAGAQAVARHLQSNRIRLSLPQGKHLLAELQSIERHRVAGDDCASDIAGIKPKWQATKKRIKIEADACGKRQLKIQQPMVQDDCSVDSDTTLKTSNRRREVPDELSVQNEPRAERKSNSATSSGFANRFYLAVHHALAPYAFQITQRMRALLPSPNRLERGVSNVPAANLVQRFIQAVKSIMGLRD